MENYKIIIQRELSFYGSALKFTVSLDGVPCGSLSNGATLAVYASSPGVHTLSFSAIGVKDTFLQILIQENVSETIIYAKAKPTGIDVFQQGTVPGEIGSVSTRENIKQKKRMGCFSTVGVILAVFLVIVIIGAIASGGNTEKSNANTSDYTSASASTPSVTATPEFTPVTGYVGNWEVTVNGFSFQNDVSVGLLYHYESSENGQYCLVNVTVKNIGNEAQTFLPYISFNGDTVAKILWNGYEYTRSELFFADDTLSSEQLNPLVSATGDIIFDLPYEVITSEIPPSFVINVGTNVFSCDLIK